MVRKILLVMFLLIFSVSAETLRGGVSEEFIPSGFYGSWGVISKIISSNNPSLFNAKSKDVWTLSGYNNVLILENLENNARSEIIIKDKTADNKTLKFEREKIVKRNNNKIIYREIVEFVLNDKNFSGHDKFIVEKYENDKLLDKSEAIYRVEGVKISGDNPY